MPRKRKIALKRPTDPVPALPVEESTHPRIEYGQDDTDALEMDAGGITVTDVPIDEDITLGEPPGDWIDPDDLPPLPEEPEAPVEHTEGFVYMHPACGGIAFYLDHMPHPSMLTRRHKEPCLNCGMAMGPLAARHVRERRDG